MRLRAAWPTLCLATPATTPQRLTSLQPTLKPHPLPHPPNGTSCVFMKPIDPGKRTLLDGKDDSSIPHLQNRRDNSATPPPRSDNQPFWPRENAAASPSSPTPFAPTGISASARHRNPQRRTLYRPGVLRSDGHWENWTPGIALYEKAMRPLSPTRRSHPNSTSKPCARNMADTTRTTSPAVPLPF